MICSSTNFSFSVHIFLFYPCWSFMRLPSLAVFKGGLLARKNLASMFTFLERLQSLDHVQLFDLSVLPPPLRFASCPLFPELSLLLLWNFREMLGQQACFRVQAYFLPPPLSKHSSYRTNRECSVRYDGWKSSFLCYAVFNVYQVWILQSYSHPGNRQAVYTALVMEYALLLSMTCIHIRT